MKHEISIVLKEKKIDAIEQKICVFHNPSNNNC